MSSKGPGLIPGHCSIFLLYQIHKKVLNFDLYRGKGISAMSALSAQWVISRPIQLSIEATSFKYIW